MPSCSSESGDVEGERGAQAISAEEARGMMVSDKVCILDVRSREEYDERHIANAVLLPVDEISEESASAAIAGKNETVLVYCRTGRRSAIACEALSGLGYTHVYDFGGIESWPYETIEGKAPEEGTVKNDQLPVGVKVVCGQTRSIPEH